MTHASSFSDLSDSLNSPNLLKNCDVSLNYTYCWLVTMQCNVTMTLRCHIPNAKIPPITTLLSRSAYHKSANVLSPNPMGTANQ